MNKFSFPHGLLGNEDLGLPISDVNVEWMRAMVIGEFRCIESPNAGVATTYRIKAWTGLSLDPGLELELAECVVIAVSQDKYQFRAMADPDGHIGRMKQQASP